MKHVPILAETLADKRARWEALVAEHRETLNEVIGLADANPNVLILKYLAEDAARFLGVLERAARDPLISETSAYGSLGDWGRNGHAPRIEGLLRSARFHAEQILPENARKVA